VQPPPPPNTSPARIGRVPWRRLAAAGGVAAALGGLAVLFFFDPSRTPFYPRCPLHALTGLNCSGCGSLRALSRLVHGDVAGAMSFNPLAVLAIPAIGLLLWRRRWLYHPRTPWIILVILLAHGILRNIRVWPFTLLGPP
jgi:hypothetical protein